METPPELEAERSLVFRAHDSYRALLGFAEARRESGADSILGGWLLYAGELDEAGCGLVVASNVAGAASLSCAADPATGKRVIRAGILDFAVNSLDEALRILKNEIRKKEAVSVCVTQPCAAIQAEMWARGVVPHLTRAAISEMPPAAVAGEADSMMSLAAVAWWVASEPARWLPKVDAVALECLPMQAVAARRWVQLAPRYLGRAGRLIRMVRADREFAVRFVASVRSRVECGELVVPIQIEVSSQAGFDRYSFGRNPVSEG